MTKCTHGRRARIHDALRDEMARIVNEDTERRKDRGESGSRQLCGLPAAWAANSFKTFWLQSFAMVQARTQANSIDVWVRKSTPLVGYVHEG